MESANASASANERVWYGEYGMARTAWRVRVRMRMRVRMEEYGMESANGRMRMEGCEWKDVDVRVWAREYECENGMESANGRVRMAECE
jgi:hypothetical protein